MQARPQLESTTTTHFFHTNFDCKKDIYNSAFNLKPGFCLSLRHCTKALSTAPQGAAAAAEGAVHKALAGAYGANDTAAFAALVKEGVLELLQSEREAEEAEDKDR